MDESLPEAPLRQEVAVSTSRPTGLADQAASLIPSAPVYRMVATAALYARPEIIREGKQWRTSSP
jgi:hypothetical protein